MHDRNIFKDSPPDFEQLSDEYPEFRPFVQCGTSGKCYVNFKDPASLRALSVVLLKKYFNVDIEIPLNRLIPTIPLRLNYVHWIEDLVDYKNNANVIGIDIGSGASCVYSLLLHKMNQWKMITTEVDEESLEYARKNVKRNHAEKHITVVCSKKEQSIFEAAMDNASTTVDFTMCNPPFFAEVQDNHQAADRTSHRPPPASISTASESESFTEGGEVEFVKRMIDESLSLKSKIRWFTTMLGKKSSLITLTKYLKKNEIDRITMTEFKQGRTMRWGLAWTFTETLKNVDAKAKKIKKMKPFFLALTEEFFIHRNVLHIQSDTTSKDITSTLWDIASLIANELTKLKIVYEELEHIILLNRDAYEITGKANENTWTHQRQKRRKGARFALAGDNNHKESEAKDCENADNNTCSSGKDLNSIESSLKRTFSNVDDNQEYQSDIKKRKPCPEVSEAKTEIIEKNNSTVDTGDNLPQALFSFSCTVAMGRQFSLAESDKVIVSFVCLEGNREQLHQLFLLFKNELRGNQVTRK